MPIYILVIDYILGIIMWTLIGRTAMNIFQREDSEFFFMKIFVKSTNPIIKLFKFITELDISDEELENREKIKLEKQKELMAQQLASTPPDQAEGSAQAEGADQAKAGAQAEGDETAAE